MVYFPSDPRTEYGLAHTLYLPFAKFRTTYSVLLNPCCSMKGTFNCQHYTV